MAAPTQIQTNAQGATALLSLGAGTSTQTTYPLDSAFVFDTSGDSYGFQWRQATNGTLTEIYVVPASFTGSWAATDGVVNFEIRQDYATTVDYKPGALVASGTITLNSANTYTWQGNNGLSISLTAGVIYTVLIGDADGGTTNFVTMQRDVRNAGRTYGLTNFTLHSANGFTTAGSTASHPTPIALTISGVTICPAPTRSVASRAATTLGRGNRIILSPTSPPLAIVGAYAANTLSGTFKLYTGATAIPSDTPAWSYSSVKIGTKINLQVFAMFPDAPILRPGETYYFVWFPASSTNTLNKPVTYSNPTDGIRQAMTGITGIQICDATEVSGGGSWTIDADSGVTLEMALAPVAQPTICS